jgi:hypothetical protein
MSFLNEILAAAFRLIEPAQVPESPVAPLTPPAPPTPNRPVAVDITAELDKLAMRADEPLAWKSSIVDLLKLVKLDSSLAARKHLAMELKYPGDLGDTVAMNNFLHREVMLKLAETGGIIPSELKT